MEVWFKKKTYIFISSHLLHYLHTSSIRLALSCLSRGYLIHSLNQNFPKNSYIIVPRSIRKSRISLRDFVRAIFWYVWGPVVAAWRIFPLSLEYGDSVRHSLEKMLWYFFKVKMSAIFDGYLLLGCQVSVLLNSCPARGLRIELATDLRSGVLRFQISCLLNRVKLRPVQMSAMRIEVWVWSRSPL